MQRSGFATYEVNLIHPMKTGHQNSGILFVHFGQNDSFTVLFAALEHIYHEQCSESKAFAECGFNLRSSKPAVLVAVLIEQLLQLRTLLKHFLFDIVKIRCDFFEPVVCDRSLAWRDVAVAYRSHTTADPKDAPASACGAADPAPSACGSACGAADPDKK